MDFKFIQNPVTKNWVISAPRRAKSRTKQKERNLFVHFVSERKPTKKNPIGLAGNPETVIGWYGLLPNKFPFTPIHEVIIHSPDHHKNFDELPLAQSELILKVFSSVFNTSRQRPGVYFP